MTKPLALIVGGGGVLGSALGGEFVERGYDVICLRRASAHASLVQATTLACDLANPQTVHDTVSEVVRQRGPIDVLVHNAAHFVAAPFAELAYDDFDVAWRVGLTGAVAAMQAALPAMVARGRGTALFTGATASLRGGSGFAAFASIKFALRGLSQSLAREYQPQGIHVAHIVLDGLLQGSGAIARFQGSDERAISPLDAARAFVWLAEQPRSSWTHEIDLRPFSERF